MPKLSLINSCEKYFGTKDLYEVLGVVTSASESEIKKAYYKTSLNVHPDRVTESGRKDATERFQILGQVYSILSDKDKRTIYDESGKVDEDDDEPSDWSEYWGKLFKKLTVDDIEKYKEEYQGSTEETDDLKVIYEKNKGNMTQIMESMFFADGENEDRLRGILLNLIERGDVTKYDIFVNEPQKEKEKRRQKQLREKKEAESEMLKKSRNNSPKSSGDSLVAKIRENQNKFVSVIENLEKKYGGKNASKKRTRASTSSSESSAHDADDDTDTGDDYVEMKKPQRKKVAKNGTGAKAMKKTPAAPKTTARKSMRGTTTKRGKGGRR